MSHITPPKDDALYGNEIYITPFSVGLAEMHSQNFKKITAAKSRENISLYKQFLFQTLIEWVLAVLHTERNSVRSPLKVPSSNPIRCLSNINGAIKDPLQMTLGVGKTCMEDGNLSDILAPALKVFHNQHLETNYLVKCANVY